VYLSLPLQCSQYLVPAEITDLLTVHFADTRIISQNGFSTGSLDKAIFCCAHLQQGGLRVWVKINPKSLDSSVPFARDVSKIGHWGVGDIELAINSLDRLEDAESFIQKSFENATGK
jgi:predicted transport protein